MAKIFPVINGRKLTRIIARHETVQRRLDEIALERAVLAEAQLKAHKHSGASRITVDEGDIDRYVVLDDERGLHAAMSIEFGRRDKDDKTPGVWALHDAFDLPHGR